MENNKTNMLDLTIIDVLIGLDTIREDRELNYSFY